MDYKIEDIKKPVGRSKYPFNTLEVGQSFFVPNAKQPTMGSNCIYWSGKLGREFKTSLEGDGVRIYRVK